MSWVKVEIWFPFEHGKIYHLPNLFTFRLITKQNSSKGWHQGSPFLLLILPILPIKQRNNQTSHNKYSLFYKYNYFVFYLDKKLKSNSSCNLIAVYRFLRIQIPVIWQNATLSIIGDQAQYWIEISWSPYWGLCAACLCH